MESAEKKAVMPAASVVDTETNRQSIAGTNGETKRSSQRDNYMSDDRLVVLCDGIFAIATTLLVLDIRLPSGIPNEAAFNTALWDLLKNSGVFYLITFAVIAILWIEHRRLMHNIRHQDARFTWLTFVFLVFVAFFPVTSSILASYPYPGAVILYTLTFSGCGMSLEIVWLYASWHHRLIAPEPSLEKIIRYAISLAAKPVYFALSLLLLLLPVNPEAVFLSWILIPASSFIFHFIPRKEGPSLLSRFLSHQLENW